VLGVSARAMLKALIAGAERPTSWRLVGHEGEYPSCGHLSADLPADGSRDRRAVVRRDIHRGHNGRVPGRSWTDFLGATSRDLIERLRDLGDDVVRQPNVPELVAEFLPVGQTVPHDVL
jgi:hypothetical protein